MVKFNVSILPHQFFICATHISLVSQASLSPFSLMSSSTEFFHQHDQQMSQISYHREVKSGETVCKTSNERVHAREYLGILWKLSIASSLFFLIQLAHDFAIYLNDDKYIHNFFLCFRGVKTLELK